jgi:hypothetical protein
MRISRFVTAMPHPHLQKRSMSGYQWVKDMPTMIFFDAVKDTNDFPQIDKRLEEIELAEQEMELEKHAHAHDRILTFEKLECNGNLILREWLEM